MTMPMRSWLKFVMTTKKEVVSVGKGREEGHSKTNP